MKLDICFNGRLEPRFAPLYNRIAVRNHKAFVDLVEANSKQHAKNIDWWVSSPASRNTFISPLFHYCCCIVLLQELVRLEEFVSEIVVDSTALRKIVIDLFAKEGITVNVKMARLPIRQRLKGIFLPIYVLFSNLLLFFLAKQALSMRKPIPSKPLILIDTYVLPDFVEEDRYYPGLMDALSDDERMDVWFVPGIIGFDLWQALTIVRHVRKSKRNFVLKEDFLKLKDYVYAWCHIFRIRSLKVDSSFFQGVDISSLIREELVCFNGVSSSLLPLVNYRFAKRLNESGVKLRLVIDWFENQNIDRGWNAGFRRFFPDTFTRGYQGFVASPHYLCHFPTEEEKANAVIPHEVMVIGKGMARSTRKFCSDLKVNIAPAFRFQQVWNCREFFPDLKEHAILVTLPIMESDAIRILTTLSHESAYFAGNCQVRIKPHPTSTPARIKKIFHEDWPDWFEFVSGDFNECVEKTNLLISSESSTCLETLAMGIPVIVLGNCFGLTHNPIPESISKDIWCLCYSPEELVAAIKFYLNSSYDEIKLHEAVGKIVRDEYFEPVTKKKVREFLMLETSEKASTRSGPHF